MSKISAYPEIVYPSSAAVAVIAYAGQNYKMQLKNVLASMALRPQRGPTYRDDMCSLTYHYPLGWLSISSGGVMSNRVSETDHPGIMRVTSAAGGASGVARDLGGVTDAMLIVGSEETDLIFRLIDTTDVVTRFGFMDRFVGPPLPTVVNGVYIEILGNSLNGKTSSSATKSTTASSYTLSLSTWYRVHIAISEEADLVNFYLYDSGGNLLWSDSLDTNIPTAASQLLAHVVSFHKSSAGAIAMADIDLITLQLPKELMR